MFALGGHALLGGGATMGRDDVGLICISEGNEGLGPAIPPAEQFDRSLHRVWRDKNKVELILRMTTVSRRINGDDEEDDTPQRFTRSTAQAFAQTVFTESRLNDWQRLVHERHWKSICFVHREIEEREDEQEAENAIHMAAAAAVDAAGAILAAHDANMNGNDDGNANIPDPNQLFQQLQPPQFALPQPQQQPPLQPPPPMADPLAPIDPIAAQDEERMWRRLIEPCKHHTPRLEMRGEFTEVQAWVLASMFSASSGKTAATAAHNPTPKLRVLSVTDVGLPQRVSQALGDAIHQNPCSHLRELSLSKCCMATGGWPLLLGRSNPHMQSMSEVTDDDIEVDAMNVSHGQLLEDSVASMKMEVDEEPLSVLSNLDRKPSALTQATASTSSLIFPNVTSTQQALTLRALYLSDCRLSKIDVEEVLQCLQNCHPQLETLCLNGDQNFTPDQVDPIVLAHLQTQVNIERLRMPGWDRSNSSGAHNPQIQLYVDLNRCGRRFLHARRDADMDVGPPAPMALWPLVFERIQRLHGLTLSQRASAIYYFVQELHGIATANGSGGTRPPRCFGARKGGDHAMRKSKFALGTSKSSSITNSTASVTSDSGRSGNDSAENSMQFSLPSL